MFLVFSKCLFLENKKNLFCLFSLLLKEQKKYISILCVFSKFFSMFSNFLSSSSSHCRCLPLCHSHHQNTHLKPYPLLLFSHSLFFSQFHSPLKSDLEYEQEVEAANGEPVAWWWHTLLLVPLTMLLIVNRE